MPGSELIRRLEDVQPGDIFIGPIGGLVGAGIGLGQLLIDGGFRVGDFDARHMGIVTQESITEMSSQSWPTGVVHAPYLAQAMPHGAEVTAMTYDRHWTARCAYVRLAEDYPGQAADAAAIARLMVSEGVGYSFGSYAALAAWRWGISTPRLEQWIGRRRERTSLVESGGRTMNVRLPLEAICSVFVDQAWSLTGKKIFEDGRPHQCVTPSQLAQRLLTTDGAIWGWPSRYPYP